MKLIVSDQAEADIEEIGDWIAKDNPERAVAFTRALRERCANLTTFPLRFPLVLRHEHSGIRRRPYGDYLIFYKVSTNSVEILHVLHGARDYERLLFPDEEH